MTSDVEAAMNRFEYFRKWNQETIAECCSLSKIKRYNENSIILGDGFGLANYVYFVLNGRCKIVEELYVENIKSRYKLLKPDRDVHQQQATNSTKTKNLPPKAEMHFMQVCILNPLSCFGFGEAMEGRRVISTEPTECLLIPHYWLTQQTLNNLWNKIDIFLRRHIPSTKYVFHEFVNQRKWKKNRENISRQILTAKKGSSGNKVSNVPYFLRIGKNIDSY
ncbi:uncharacterized protein LOC116167936 [Photinus pyralis]|uniref:uncharacterized protein LOC116167936 n=1 Tax=Photinus pyralis TaxID=7054 RepID=UPI001267673E|nr:uncharacterized protein LOC116167936 [Photinus pyralis]